MGRCLLLVGLMPSSKLSGYPALAFTGFQVVIVVSNDEIDVISVEDVVNSNNTRCLQNDFKVHITARTWDLVCSMQNYTLYLMV